MIEEGLNSCSSEFRTVDSKVTEDDLAPWKSEILSRVDRKITSLRRSVKYHKIQPVLKRPEVTEYLRNLHDNFVLVPIDKASNNIAVICKKYYVEIILKEIGHIGTRSNTYEIVDKSKGEIVEENVEYARRCGFKLVDAEKELPIMYWTPKMHKTPSAPRFIIASKSCSTKQISKAVSSTFKLIFRQVQNFHTKAKFLKNYNKFWIIQNTDPILEIMNRINKRKGAKSIATYDFSTLYTKLSHDKLIYELHKLIDFVFDAGDRNYIKLDTRGKAFWGKKSKNSVGYTRHGLKVAVKFLIENCFFTVGNIIVRQAIGIPMGIDPAPFWANLFLYVYETKYVTDLIGEDKAKARRFHSIKRFIDDLCTLNDGGIFGQVFQEIYPDKLELKLESSGMEASFLCLHIAIENGIFVYKLYDKRDGFPFSIVRMPYASSNIPESIFYSAMVGEILRVAHSTLRYEDFLPKATELINRLNNQGAKRNLSRRNFLKLFNRHSEEFRKYNRTSDQIISDMNL